MFCIDIEDLVSEIIDRIWCISACGLLHLKGQGNGWEYFNLRTQIKGARNLMWIPEICRLAVKLILHKSWDERDQIGKNYTVERPLKYPTNGVGWSLNRNHRQPRGQAKAVSGNVHSVGGRYKEYLSSMWSIYKIIWIIMVNNLYIYFICILK